MTRLLILHHSWLSAILLLLIILFLSLGDGYRATNSTTIRSFVVDDHVLVGNLNLIKGFEELAGFEDYVEAQLMVDFLKKNLDEASAWAFMQELTNWLEIARCSSCFNVGEFFASSQFEKEEDHKMDLRNVSKEDLDTDTRNNINILYRGVHKTGKNCGASLLTGRRRTQQDRAVCLPDLLLPSLGGSGSISRTLGFFGVFDGHNGEEASDFVSKCLAQYFIHQVYTILGSLITHTFSFDSTVQPSLSKVAANITWQGSLSYAEGCKSCSAIQKSSSEAERQMSGICESRFYRTLYKKALSKAIFSIDLAFYEEARQKGWDAGTTACVVLIMDGHVLVSHLGDSKAYFCSSPCQNISIKDVKLVRREERWPRNKLQRIIKATSKLADIETSLCKSSLVEELTQDHHPDRKQERGRIEAAGGFVEEWGGVARVNGVLAVSRSIGDLPFKRYGVICTAEHTGWKPIGSSYNYLVIASDGIFEGLEVEDTCTLISAQALSYNASNLITHKPPHHHHEHSKILNLELPIPLPPKEEVISKQQEGFTENGYLLKKIGGKNVSESAGWGVATVISSALSEDKNSQILWRESIKDIITTSKAAAVSKDIRPQQCHPTQIQDSELFNMLQMNYKSEYLDKHRTMNNSIAEKSSELDTLDPDSVAQMIVEMAYNEGSQDNLAAVVLPLNSLLRFQPPLNSVEQSCSYLDGLEQEG